MKLQTLSSISVIPGLSILNQGGTPPTTALADINMYQGWTAELYRSTSKDEQNRVNEGYREEQNKAVERRLKKKKIQVPVKIISSLQQKKK